MNDEIQIDEDEMVEGVKGVVAMSEAYAASVSVIESTTGLVDGAFEDVGNSPQEAWEEYRDLLWTCLSDSQNAVNKSAQNLADYTNEMFSVDGENAEELAAAGELEDAKGPKGE